jgi:Uma2 family endonuclease
LGQEVVRVAQALDYEEPTVPLVHGPWTEESWLALPESPCVELLDGNLLVSPNPTQRHQRIVRRLVTRLEALAPADVQADMELNVRLGTGRIFIPDGVVYRPHGEGLIFDAVHVLLVAEVVSPSSASMDRILKPNLYAQAGIPWYLRVEESANTLHLLLCELRNGAYELWDDGMGDKPLVLPEPFTGEITAEELIRRC